MIWFCFAACGYCPPYSIYFRIWILQDHVTACVQFSMIFLFSVLFSSLFVIVFVWQGTHYWWWLSPLSRLVLRVETLVVFIRMFVFVFVCYYSVMWFEFSNSEGLSLLSNVLVRYCLMVFLLFSLFGQPSLFPLFVNGSIAVRLGQKMI